MTTIVLGAGRLAARLPARVVWTGAVVAGVALVAAIRLGQRHTSLLYPDGYQYLLQARGLGEHLRPLTRLGPGGELFVPSVDAGDKPLYPALIAAAHALGAEPRASAGVIAALAAAALPSLVGLIVWRTTQSRVAAVASAAVVLASPAVAYWSGFAGPDALAQALSLGAALALISRRPRTTGALAALAALARPEYGVLAVAGIVAAAADRSTRPFAERCAVVFAGVLACVLVLLRPPLGLPSGTGSLGLTLALTSASVVVVAAWLAQRSRVGSIVAASALPIAAIALARGGRVPALDALWASEPLLLVVAAVSFPLAAGSRFRREALLVAGALAALGGCYFVKNANSERYAALLWPLAAIVVGFAIAGLDRRRGYLLAPVAAATLGAVVFTAAVSPARPEPGAGSFGALAQTLAHEHGVLVSAAPDAYAVLLPRLAHRTLEDGASGLVLVDGAARCFDGAVHTDGHLVARITTNVPFVRNDGSLDRGAALLYRGRVTRVGPVAGCG